HEGPVSRLPHVPETRDVPPGQSRGPLHLLRSAEPSAASLGPYHTGRPGTSCLTSAPLVIATAQGLSISRRRTTADVLDVPTPDEEKHAAPSPGTSSKRIESHTGLWLLWVAFLR